MIDLIDSFLQSTTANVFGTMLNWTITSPGGRTLEGESPPVRFHEINGSIGFGGSLTGNLFFCGSQAMARAMAGEILGSSDNLTAREISDVVGEITNMLAGGCKSRLCDHGYSVVMSIPNIVTGRQIMASSQFVNFMVLRQFTCTPMGADFEISILGKWN